MSNKEIIHEQIVSTINTYYVIVSKDRRYIVSGKGFDIEWVQLNRSWRPRMFKSESQALSLFSAPYNWGHCYCKDIKVPSINYYYNPSKAEQDVYYKNLLANYFDIIKIGLVELQ